MGEEFINILLAIAAISASLGTSMLLQAWPNISPRMQKIVTGASWMICVACLLAAVCWNAVKPRPPHGSLVSKIAEVRQAKAQRPVLLGPADNAGNDKNHAETLVGTDIRSRGSGTGMNITSVGTSAGPSLGGETIVHAGPGQTVTGTRVTQEGAGTGLRVTQSGPGTGYRSIVTAGDSAEGEPQGNLGN